MTHYLSFTSNERNATALVLENGTAATGYYRVTGSSWGVFDNQSLLVSNVDSFGAVNVGGGVAARELRLPILVLGDGSHSTLVSRWSALASAVLSVDGFGGRIRWRPSGGSGLLLWDVESARLEGEYWGRNAELGAFVEVELVLVASPAPYSETTITDSFATDTLGTGGVYNIGGADWTAYGSSSASVGGGILTTATTTGASFYRHTGTGNSYGDVQNTVRVKMPTAVASKAMGCGRLDASGNGLLVHAYSDGAGAGTLQLSVVEAGTVTSLTTTAVTTLTADTYYWVRMRVEGNVLFGEWWAAEPTPLGTPTHSTSSAFSTTNARKFGVGQSGQGCVYWHTQGSGTVVFDSVVVEPNVFRSATLPCVLPCSAVPGDVPAKTSVSLTATGSAASAAPIWAGLGWMPRPEKTNRVWTATFEGNSSAGWGFAAISGVQTNSGVAFAADATYARTGAYSGKIGATGASTSAGGNFTMYGLFKKGQSYVATLYAYAPSSTTSMVLKLGISGDVASSAARALTSSWEPYTVTWTPTADSYIAYLSFQTNAATATTCYIDDVQVFELRDVADVYTDPTADDPVLCLPFGEASGSLTDTVGSRTGTVSGNPIYGKLGAIPGDSTTCIDWDGSGDYASFAFDSDLNTSVFSVSGWIMRDVDSGAGEILVENYGAGTTGWGLGISSSDLFQLLLSDGSLSGTTSVTTISTGVWYHVAATYDGTNARVYINGHLEKVNADGYTVRSSGSMYFMATNAGTSAFSGKSQFFRQYNRVLTGDEILKQYAGGPPALKEGASPPFGVIHAASVDTTNKGSFFSIASDSNYLSGYELAGTGNMSSNATAEYYLAPWAVTPDDYARGEYQFRVFARLEIASTQGDINIVTSLKPEGGTSYGGQRYTQEWGTLGKSIPTPDSGTPFRWAFLGTLVATVDADRPKRWKLRLSVTNDASSTGTFGIDHLVLVPARRSVSSITGVDNSDYTGFITSTSQTTKSVGWDKRCETSDPTSNVSRHPYPDNGLGGANLLLPTGDVDVVAMLADYQPDRSDANAAGAGKSVSTTVAITPNPQYVFARV